MLPLLRKTDKLTSQAIFPSHFLPSSSMWARAHPESAILLLCCTPTTEALRAPVSPMLSAEVGKLVKGLPALTGVVWGGGGVSPETSGKLHGKCGSVTTARLGSQGRTWVSHNFRLSGNILAPVFSQPLNNVKIRWWNGAEGLEKNACCEKLSTPVSSLPGAQGGGGEPAPPQCYLCLVIPSPHTACYPEARGTQTHMRAQH